MIHNIIFDLFGVLLNCDINRLIFDHITNIEDHSFIKNSIFNHQDWAELDRGNITEKDAVLRICERTKYSEEKVAELFALAKQAIEENIALHKLLVTLSEKGYSLYCLSNSSNEFYNYMRKRFSFFDLFKGVIISAQVGISKPDITIFEYLMEKFSLISEETLFIDDNPANLETAIKMGIKTLYYNNTRDAYNAIKSLLGIHDELNESC